MDAFTKYGHGRTLDSRPMPLAYGEVAETGRLLFLSLKDIAALGALALVGWFLASLCGWV